MIPTNALESSFSTLLLGMAIFQRKGNIPAQRLDLQTRYIVLGRSLQCSSVCVPQTEENMYVDLNGCSCSLDR